MVNNNNNNNWVHRTRRTPYKNTINSVTFCTHNMNALK